MPAISVIIPVYQAEACLRESVRSVLEQTFRDLELILVDDGSPDGSGALCDAIAGEDDRVRVIHKENGGVSTARNEGIAVARGMYIAFCDADDALLPDALERLYNAAEREGADTAGGGHFNLWPDGRREEEPAALPAGVYGPEELRGRLVAPLLGQRLDFGQGVLNGYIWRFLFSREIVVDYGVNFEGAYLEDEMFLMEYFLRAKKLVVEEGPVYCYSQNPDSVTKNYLPNYMTQFRRVMERKRELAQSSGLGAEMPGWEHNANWAGLLIAIGNEYAPGNPKSLRKKTAYVKKLCCQEEMARALTNLQPKGMAGNKQLVANLVLGGHFILLSLLYAVKNRRR